jgi:hypothetical protein
MNIRLHTKSETRNFDDVVRDAVAALLTRRMADESSLLGKLDRWTRNRIAADISAKTDLVLEAGNPVEYCYQNLIREIDVEAEMGVLLANDMLCPVALKEMINDPGVSGELYREMERIAPVMFEDEYKHSNGLDLVWSTVQAGYDRAHLEAEVSELIMRFLMDSADSTRDMSNALRSMFYAFHEDGIRRQFDMNSMLEEREMHDLFIMVSELIQRAGSYEDRIDAISDRARLS